jgi:AraC family transcriptional regulator
MDLEGRWKLPPTNLIASSAARKWKGIGVELRRHTAGEVPEMVADRMVIGIAVRGNHRAIIHRRGNGVRQATHASRGTVWLCPQGIEEDNIRITSAIPEMLHIYLPTTTFVALAQEDDFPDVTRQYIRYKAGFQDPLLFQVGRVIMEELATESSSGRLLVETAALTVAARLLQSHGEAALPYAARTRPANGLDITRLRRVIDFIEAHTHEDVGVDDLASVACLSPFHFSRAFKEATGLTPHRFISQRRLQRARLLLETSELSITDVASMANFSSQANFTRAFSRIIGISPGEYRRRRT